MTPTECPKSPLNLRSLSVDHLDALPPLDIAGCDFLSEIESVEFLSIARCIDFSPASITRSPERIRELTVTSSRGVINVQSVLQASGLQTLTLAAHGRTTVTCDSVAGVRLEAQRLRSIRLIGELDASNVLFVARNVVLSRTPHTLLSAAVSERLETIRIEKVAGIDLSLLNGAPQLREVDIVDCADLVDLAPLLELKRLAAIRVAGPNLVLDEEVLRMLRTNVALVEVAQDSRTLFGQ